MKKKIDIEGMEWEDIVQSVICKKQPTYDQSRIHIRNVMAKKKITIVDFAKALGVNYRSVQRTLAGKERLIENMSLKKCHKIALILGISLDELLAISLESREEFLEREYGRIEKISDIL